MTKEESTYLKGCAALLIVMHHLVVNNYLPQNGLIGNIFSNIGSCNVTLFLFLGGYGAFISYMKLEGKFDAWKYLNRRVVKIYIPFVAINSAYQAWYYSIDKHYSTKDDIIAILQGILGFVHDENWLPDRAMWYMTFMFFWYIITAIVFSINISDGLKICVLFSISCFIYILYLGEPFLSLTQVCRQAAFGFPLGCIYAKIYSDRLIPDSKWKKLIAYIIVFFLALKIFLGEYTKCDFSKQSYQIINLSYIVVVVMLVKIYITILGYKLRGLLLLGNISYYIYLLHMKVLVFLNTECILHGLPTEWGYIKIICYVILLIIISWLAKSFFEKVSK